MLVVVLWLVCAQAVQPDRSNTIRINRLLLREYAASGIFTLYPVHPVLGDSSSRMADLSVFARVIGPFFLLKDAWISGAPVVIN